jgi:hypothetical protein
MVRGGSKLEKELKQDDDGTILIPKEAIPEVTISETVAKKSVKRQLSEKQQENAKKLGEASKLRWEKLREEKARMKAEAEAKEKEEEKKLIDAGSHVRVKVVKGKPRSKGVIKEPIKPLKLVRQPAYETDDSSDHSDTDVTETEEDSDVDEQSRASLVRPSRVRRQVKKNLRVLQKVDEALAFAPSNPYLAMLSGRWR